MKRRRAYKKMTCSYCGTENSENAKFCQECGQPLLKTVNEYSNPNPAVTTKKRTLRLGLAAAVLLVVFIVLFGFNFFSQSRENRLKGTWQRDNSSLDTNEVFTYTFTSRGGTNAYSAEEQNHVNEQADFEWYITKDNDLILLWSNTSCTKYTWNADYNNYKLSSNEFNWYLKGNRLYLSSTAAPDGYYVYTK